jgi:hypothetical protein
MNYGATLNLSRECYFNCARRLWIVAGTMAIANSFAVVIASGPATPIHTPKAGGLLSSSGALQQP